MRLTLVTPPGVTLSGTLASASPVVTGLPATAALAPGQVVRGAGVPSGTLVLSVDSASGVTLTANATATGPASLSFAVEPVTVAEATRQVRVDNPADYPDLARMIGQARAWCEKETRQAFLTQTVRQDMDEMPYYGGYFNREIRRAGPSLPYWLPTSTKPIDLMRPPVQSIASVKYYDYANNLLTIDPGLYVFEQGTPARIAPAFGKTWPISQPRIDGYQVTYVVGYGDTPDAIPLDVLDVIRTAILLGVAGLYRNRGDGPAAMPEDAMRSILSTLDHGSYG